MSSYEASFPLRVATDVYERMKAAAALREMSLAAWLREAIREKLAREQP